MADFSTFAAILDSAVPKAGNEVLKARIIALPSAKFFEFKEVIIFKEIKILLGNKHSESLYKNCLNHYNRMIRSKTVAS